MPRISATDRRTALLSAAAALIAREGVAAATTRAIVAEAQMSLASFHYVFNSRDEMLGDLISSIVDHQSEEMLATLIEGTTLVETLDRGLAAFFDVIQGDPSREQALFELFHYSLRHPELMSFGRTMYERYHDVASQLLEAAAASSGVQWERPLNEVATIAVALTDGITLNWLASGDAAEARRMTTVAATLLSNLAVPAMAENSLAEQETR